MSGCRSGIPKRNEAEHLVQPRDYHPRQDLAYGTRTGDLAAFCFCFAALRSLFLEVIHVLLIHACAGTCQAAIPV